MSFISFDGYKAIANLGIAQNTLLGTNTQTMIGGSVTTAAPTYTTGTINPISLTTAGAIRVDNSATTQPVSGTVAVSNAFSLDATLAKLTITQGTSLGSNTQALVGGSVTTAAPSYSTGQISPLSITTAGDLRTFDSHFIVSAALADAESNPTVGSIATYLKVFNGTTWDRLRSGSSTTVSSITGFLNNVGYGKFNQAFPLALTDAQFAPVQLNSYGMIRTADGYAPLYEDQVVGVAKVEQRFSYLNQAGTTAGVTVKSGAGFLHSLTINTPAASAVITLYDNTAASGTKIATITLPATLVNEGPNFTLYDVSFATGLELVVATGAADVTISYR